MNDPRSLDDKYWEKIVGEAFASNEEHKFSFGYKTRKDSMLRGDTMKRKDIKHSSSRRMALHIAAAAALVAVVPAGLFFAGRSGDAPSADMSEDIQVTAPAEETTSAPETEPVTEQQYLDLQLHEAPVYVETMEEAENVMQEHSIYINWDDRHNYMVDVEHYSELLQGGDTDSPEAKSFIYHMMLNSYLYLDTAKGTLLTQGNDISSIIDFQVDLNSQECSARTSTSYDDRISEFYVYDDKIISAELSQKTYNELTSQKEESIDIPEDNYRYIEIAPPDHGLCYCPSNSLMFGGGNAREEVMPEALAVAWLNDFDKWDISAISEHFGRPCAEITGFRDNGHQFTIVTDIYTGMMLEYTETNNGNIVESKKLTALEINVPLQRAEFDPNGFQKKELIDF